MCFMIHWSTANQQSISGSNVWSFFLLLFASTVLSLTFGWFVRTFQGMTCGLWLTCFLILMNECSLGKVSLRLTCAHTHARTHRLIYLPCRRIAENQSALFLRRSDITLRITPFLCCSKNPRSRVCSDAAVGVCPVVRRGCTQTHSQPSLPQHRHNTPRMMCFYSLPCSILSRLKSTESEWQLEDIYFTEQMS